MKDKATAALPNPRGINGSTGKPPVLGSVVLWRTAARAVVVVVPTVLCRTADRVVVVVVPRSVVVALRVVVVWAHASMLIARARVRARAIMTRVLFTTSPPHAWVLLVDNSAY